jgi:hypothetical protein
MVFSLESSMKSTKEDFIADSSKAFSMDPKHWTFPAEVLSY